jgi:hypothetical protein
MDGAFTVFLLVITFISGVWLGIDYGQTVPMRFYCEEAGGALQEMNDERIMCWDAPNNRVIPITVTYPLPTEVKP